MAKSSILGPDGQPMNRAALTSEQAGPTLGGVRSVLTGYPGDGMTPERLAAILREVDTGDPVRYLELAEQIEERDLHYAGVLGTRKRSVAQLDITVDAASDAAEHVAHADMVREWLNRDELQGELFDIMDAVGKGFSITEIIWDTSSGQWQPARLEWRDPRWFEFDRADGRTPLLKTEDGPQPLQPFKFITAVFRAKSGLPIRSGIARLAAWAWMFKSYAQRDWAIFVQTYGQPIRVGKFGPDATEADKDLLFRAVANIAGDCAAIIPESMVIEFIKSEGAAQTGQLYRDRVDWLDQQVSKGVLGQTATTDAIAGGHAVGQEHRQVQEDIEKADAKTLAGALNCDLVKPWIDLEYGPQDMYPRLRIGRSDAVDLKLIVDSVAALVPLGLKVQASELRDLIGLTEPEKDAELLTAPAPAPAFPGQALPGQKMPGQKGPGQALPRPGDELHLGVPETPPRDALDDLADDADLLAQPAADKLIDAIRSMVEGADTLEEVRDGLLALRPQLDPAALAEAMRKAMVFAELSGRSDTIDGG
jgi:phage gp29-like protein